MPAKPERLTGKRNSNGEGSIAGDSRTVKRKGVNSKTLAIQGSGGPLVRFFEMQPAVLYVNNHSQAYYVGIDDTSDKVVDISIIVYCELMCWYRIPAA
jgi:hypothetical protein